VKDKKDVAICLLGSVTKALQFKNRCYKSVTWILYI